MEIPIVFDIGDFLIEEELTPHDSEGRQVTGTCKSDSRSLAMQ